MFNICAFTVKKLNLHFHYPAPFYQSFGIEGGASSGWFPQFLLGLSPIVNTKFPPFTKSA
jgi:hypothetical protein